MIIIAFFLLSMFVCVWSQNYDPVIHAFYHSQSEHNKQYFTPWAMLLPPEHILETSSVNKYGFESQTNAFIARSVMDELIKNNKHV